MGLTLSLHLMIRRRFDPRPSLLNLVFEPIHRLYYQLTPIPFIPLLCSFSSPFALSLLSSHPSLLAGKESISNLEYIPHQSTTPSSFHSRDSVLNHQPEYADEKNQYKVRIRSLFLLLLLPHSSSLTLPHSFLLLIRIQLIIPLVLKPIIASHSLQCLLLNQTKLIIVRNPPKV